MDNEADIRAELLRAREEIAELKLKTTTVLSADHFLALVVTVPLLGAFTILGIILVWKTTSAPQESAPFLRDWLLVLSIFSNPVAAIVGAIVAKWSSGEKGGEDKK
jgi:hypothetical protein